MLNAHLYKHLKILFHLLVSMSDFQKLAFMGVHTYLLCLLHLQIPLL